MNGQHKPEEAAAETQQSALVSSAVTAKPNAAETAPGIDYTKDFIWGSDQDEYVDEP
ncbi:hypothetical protein N0M98_21960 [Paenibacillus doosanensis]|uniref:Uncharacterized protein n=1 Tax=Paenibacillus konkukensis TaxID=2020716 RepID=A0ABY4RWB5_9BACL|nr:MULTISPECIES: hypothetical protein [Paenibacillus]MCS7462793.1 hypothetical protein [Paenibacillus doosanensis]UQZ86059.1 hypothetical protein SK3146_05351 [Paenibacillus konkukensis]